MVIAPRAERKTDDGAPRALHEHALGQLAFIRDTMARAGSFTSVSGAGVMGTGVVGLLASAASLVVPLERAPWQWLALWLGTAVVAITVAALTIRAKALRTGQLLTGAAARTFALALFPGLAAGAVMTVVLVGAREWRMLPGAWLTLYGAAVTAGGALSVRPVPVMGATFFLLGVGCLLAPAAWSLPFLAAGFGGAHLFFGFRIARHHGG
ncbi:MAG: hypothetical protein HYR75_05060 [Gemmatimonadetes bacterium]|nr:hypothetical protein [Gemmatimonadota bacterium]MBI3504335.1 hypothetical protein [Pseudomonadota bacterium]